MARNSVTVKVDGLQQLGERMRGLSRDMKLKIARSATAAAAGVIKKAAIANVPVADEEHFYYQRTSRGGKRRRSTGKKTLIKPGNLRKNIITKRIPDAETTLTSQHIVTVRHKGKGVVGEPYAEGIFTEYGTASMAPEPWLRPAFDRNKEQSVQEMKKRIEARLKKAGV